MLYKTFTTKLINHLVKHSKDLQDQSKAKRKEHHSWFINNILDYNEVIKIGIKTGIIKSKKEISCIQTN